MWVKFLLFLIKHQIIRTYGEVEVITVGSKSLSYESY
jgi:hypothetical protein